jgi:hypothetical protein
MRSDHDGESQQRENCDMRENDHAPRRPDAIAKTPGRRHHRGCHTHEGVQGMSKLTKNTTRRLDPIAVELAGTRLLLRALLGYLLVDDPAEAGHAVAALIAKIDRMSAASVIIGDPSGEARKAIRDSAVVLIADLGQARGPVQ